MIILKFFGPCWFPSLLTGHSVSVLKLLALHLLDFWRALGLCPWSFLRTWAPLVTLSNLVALAAIVMQVLLTFIPPALTSFLYSSYLISPPGCLTVTSHSAWSKPNSWFAQMCSSISLPYLDWMATPRNSLFIFTLLSLISISNPLMYPADSTLGIYPNLPPPPCFPPPSSLTWIIAVAT